MDYSTSKDYKHLKELLDAGYEVVCFVTYNFFQYDKKHEPVMVTDVCRAKLIQNENPKYNHYNIGVRGHVFIEYWSEPYVDYTFEEICEKEQLEYIEPIKH